MSKAESTVIDFYDILQNVVEIKWKNSTFQHVLATFAGPVPAEPERLVDAVCPARKGRPVARPHGRRQALDVILAEYHVS